MNFAELTCGFQLMKAGWLVRIRLLLLLSSYFQRKDDRVVRALDNEDVIFLWAHLMEIFCAKDHLLHLDSSCLQVLSFDCNSLLLKVEACRKLEESCHIGVELQGSCSFFCLFEFCL